MGSNIPFSASGQKLTAPFTPTQIPGCQVWLDAADTTTYRLSGTNLTSWSDKSGTGKTISFSGTPTYKANALATLPTVVFNTTMLTTTFGSSIGSGDVAYFAVWIQYTNNSGILMSLGGTSTPALGLGCNGKYNLFEWGGPESDYNFTASISYNQYVIQTGTIRSNAMLCSVNGYTGTNATSTQSQTSTTFTIGSSSSVGSGYKINGEVAEILVYVGTVSTAQQQQIEGYLAWKWGLQSSLNPSHPYATVNPDPPIYPVVPYPFLSYVKSSPEFDPRLISGCVLWLDGADPNGTGTLPANGTTLTTWKDKSVSNFPFTSIGSAYNTTAVNGLPGINIGTNFFGYDPGSAQNNWQEVFAVGLWTGGSTFDTYNGFVTGSIDINGTPDGIIFIGDIGSTSWYNLGNGYQTPFLNGSQTASALPAISTPFQIRTFTGSAVSIRGLRFGIDRPYADRKWIGYISEVICYNTALSITQRQQVEAYFAKKWKLTSVLSTQNIYAPGSYLTFVNAPIVPVLPMRRAVQGNKFLPTQYSNCVLWLDATDVNGTGTNPATGTITSWTDKSGSGNSSTGSAGTPTLTANLLNGKPGVAFSSSSSSYIQIPVVVTTDWSIFIVFSTTQTGPVSQPFPGPGQAHTDNGINHWWGGQGIFDGEVGGSVNDFGISLCGSPTAYLGYGVGNLTTNQDTTEFSATAVNTGAGFIGEFFRTQNTGNLQMYVNGAFQVSTTGSTATRSAPPTLKIGSIQTTPAGYFFTGNVYEIVCYTRVLSTIERQQIEGYFAWKWGLKASITSGHPFFLIPPLPIP